MESIEVSGKSVDEAVQQALARLGKHREEVDISVFQEPSRGTFGLGSKDARVRVTVRMAGKSAVITPELADAILGPDDPDVPLPENEAYDDGEEYLEDDQEEFDEEEEGDEEVEDEDEHDFQFQEFDINELEDGGAFINDPSIPTLILNPPLSPREFVEQANLTKAHELQDVENPSREDVEITVDVLQHILRYMNIHATVQVRSTAPLNSGFTSTTR